MILRGNQRLFTSEEASHWYYIDGTPCYTVPYSSKNREGERRKTTIGDARKLGLMPSVTTIMSLINKPGLNDWRCEMAVLAALTLPRIEGETDQAFAKRAVIDATSIAGEAADFGTLVHDYIEDLARGKDPNPLPAIEAWSPFIRQWFTDNIATVVAAENTVVNTRLCYAGRRDLKAIHRSHTLCTIDFKTQGIKEGQTAKFWPEWAEQLAAYRMADGEPSNLLSVVINSKKPEPLAEKLWTPEEAKQAEKVFESIVRLWMAKKNYSI